MEQEKIGYKLKELRNKHNYTQEQLAEKLYISRQAISRWEQGISLPDYDTLIKLCNLYCISLDELFFEQKNSDWIVENYLKLFYEKNKLKCTKNIIIAFLILVVILFSLYFTLVNYNKNSIYEINYSSNEISCNNGLVVTSTKYIYLKPCDLVFQNENEKIDKVVYYYSDNNERHLIFSGGYNSTNFLWRDERKNKELFDYNTIDKSLKPIFVDIYTNLNEYTIRLNVSKTHSNSLIK